jgi:hypothetical protein
MAIRRFGPVLGAGVQVTEEEAEEQIVPAPTGVTVKIGEFEKGPPDVPQFLAGRRDFDRRNGGLIATGDAPQCARDFYKLGRGSGELITYRVTAGDELSAALDLWTRHGTAAAPASGRALLGTLTAKNGGRWAGRRDVFVDEPADLSTEITATTLDTGVTMIENEWIGGTLDMKKVTTKTYRIVGNTAAGVISVEADQDLVADFAAGGGTPVNRYVLTRANEDHLLNEQHLAAEILDGEENPTGEFGIVLYGTLRLNQTSGSTELKRWKNLSADPAKPNYWVTVINKDPGNYWVVAADLYAGDKTVAAARPANWYGQSSALTATKLTIDLPDYVLTSPGAADPTIVIARNANVRSQVITGTVSNTGADIDWVTTIGPIAQKAVTFDGVPTDLGVDQVTVTVTNGATVLADGDTIVITVLAFEPDELVGGKVWPDIENEPDLVFTISANGRDYVDVRTGLDLTDGGGIAAGAVAKLVYPQQFVGGADSAAVTDADYLLALDAVLSPLNKIFGKNKGLVKVSTPGLASSIVTKAGLEYAAARNYQFKVEFPDNIVDEAGAITYINTTIGRSDYGVCHFPSFGFILDPDVEQTADDVPLKQVPLIGMILGRESLVARQFEGYHKAPSGIDVTLPDVVELTTGDAETAVILNEELTNPQGVNLVKFRQGVVILWGDRTISPTSAWRFHHQRALMSHYENVLRENFDWIVFAINEPKTQERAKTTLRAFFLPEWVKGALRGDKFADAFKLKIDDEINTDATRAAGDLHAEMKLRLADTVERFRMIVGKSGIFDAVE